MQRTGSLEKTLMLGKSEGKNRRGQQRMRELDSISDFMDMNLSKLQEIMKDSEFWNTTVHETTKSRTQLSDWTATIIAGDGVRQLNLDLKDSKKIFQLYSLVTCKFSCLANDLSGVSDGKQSAYSAGDLVLIPGLTIQLIMDWRRQQLYPQL